MVSVFFLFFFFSFLRKTGGQQQRQRGLGGSLPALGAEPPLPPSSTKVPPKQPRVGGDAFSTRHPETPLGGLQPPCQVLAGPHIKAIVLLHPAFLGGAGALPAGEGATPRGTPKGKLSLRAMYTPLQQSCTPAWLRGAGELPWGCLCSASGSPPALPPHPTLQPPKLGRDEGGARVPPPHPARSVRAGRQPWL